MLHCPKTALVLTAAVLLAVGVRPAARAQNVNMSTDQPLARYRDHNRVLLVFTASAQDPAYLEQRRLWKGEDAGFADRQLIVIPVLADASTASGAALRKAYAMDLQPFSVVLIGKDGHDAYRSLKPVTPEMLYGVIDAMPMRQAEMKRAAHHRN